MTNTRPAKPPSFQTLRIIKHTIVGLVRTPPWKRTRHSETSKCRESLSRFCVGDGIDVGFGGDPIVPRAICMDLPNPYARYKNTIQHLHGSADDLRWFRADALDWLYSSHVLEDFEDTEKVLSEWIRVVRPGGNIILYLPDEQTYRVHCAKQGKPPNAHHIHVNFGLTFLKTFITKRTDVKIIHEKFPVGIYSFEMVLQKQ